MHDGRYHGEFAVLLRTVAIEELAHLSHISLDLKGGQWLL